MTSEADKNFRSPFHTSFKQQTFFLFFFRTYTAGTVQQTRGQPILDQVRAQKGRLRGPAHGQLPRVRRHLAR